MNNVLKPLATSVWIPLGLTAGASVPGAGIYDKVIASGTQH